MTIEHNTLTGSQLHEPKGADIAASGQIYKADGAGAGSFQDPGFLAAVAPSTDHSIPRHDGTGGVLQDSGVTIDDSDSLVVPGTISEAGALLSATYAKIPIIKYKDADNTAVTSSTTLVDDDDLVGFSLEASTVYKVEGDIYVSSDDGSTNVDVAFQLVSGTLTDSQVYYTSMDPTTPHPIVSSDQIAITDEATVTDMSGTKPVYVRLSGFVSVSNAAVLDFQFAQNTVIATNTQTHKGSTITFTPIQ